MSSGTGTRTARTRRLHQRLTPHSTSIWRRVNQMASSRFGTQHSQAIPAYAVSNEKSTIPAAADRRGAAPHPQHDSGHDQGEAADHPAPVFAVPAGQDHPHRRSRS